MKNPSEHKDSSRGSITLPILIGIVILGAIYLVGGILPHLEPVDTGEQGRVVQIDFESIDNSSGSSSLRLKTIPFKTCSETTAVDFLLDRSDSMNDKTPAGETKLQILKDSVIPFIASLSDDSIIGVQYFSANQIRTLIEIQRKDSIGDYAAIINSLTTGGGTPTHDALQYSYERLREAVPRYPDKQFAFIFVSDGDPFPSTQDPRLFNPNPADQIKDLGVEVYSIGILDEKQEADGKMKILLEDIASKPENAYISPNGEDLEKIISQISTDICQKAT